VADAPKIEVTSRPRPLFKFCSAEGAAAILEHNQIFVTSPLDLNDPFEMRPGWTDEHASRQNLNEEMRTALTTGMPVFSARTEGPVYIGQMPRLEVQPPIDVESQRGIADGLNERAFEILHQHFRVLSLVPELFLCSEPGDVLPADGESGEEATLMWSHYADQFQGVCLALDPTAFDNGTQPGGITVQYPPERRGLPTTFYDSYLTIGRSPSTDEEAKLRQSFIDFLTAKSPAWKYEKEVRMIYDLPKHLKSANYRRVELACPRCQARGEPPSKCKQALYRDAVHVPPDAILAIIFGADCPSVAVDRILKIRSGAPFKNIRIYWSSLHSARYAVHYIEADAEYIRFFYEHRDTIMAGAKKHYTRGSKGLIYIPARKSEMYDMDKMSARRQDGESETA
jgi:hypothetical protein